MKVKDFREVMTSSLKLMFVSMIFVIIYFATTSPELWMRIMNVSIWAGMILYYWIQVIVNMKRYLDKRQFESSRSIDELKFEAVNSNKRTELTELKRNQKIYDCVLLDLPVGTIFWVINGAWEGEVIEVDGNKYIRNNVNTFELTSTEQRLNIEILAGEDIIERAELPVGVRKIH